MMVREKSEHGPKSHTTSSSDSSHSCNNASNNNNNKGKVHVPTPKQLLKEVQWLSDHDGHSLQGKLEQELSDILEVTVKL